MQIELEANLLDWNVNELENKWKKCRWNPTCNVFHIRTKLASMLWNFTWHIPIIHFDSYLILLYRAAQMWERIFFKVKPLSDESLMYSRMLLSTVSRLKSWGFKALLFATLTLKTQICVYIHTLMRLQNLQKPQIMIMRITNMYYKSFLLKV